MDRPARVYLGVRLDRHRSAQVLAQFVANARKKCGPSRWRVRESKALEPADKAVALV